MIDAKILIRNHKGEKEWHEIMGFDGTFEAAYAYAKSELPQAKVMLMVVPNNKAHINFSIPPEAA